MKKSSFRKFEEMCKKIWTTLSKSGGEDKTEAGDIIYKFINHCPACEISSYFSPKRVQNCQFCPIDVWREKARKMNCKPGDAVCDREGEIYSDWSIADQENRKILSKQISELSWSFLPEYKNVKISFPKE